MYKDYVFFSCLLRCNLCLWLVQTCPSSNLFSVLCFHDELTIVLRKLTIGLRTLILFEGDRRELSLDPRELTLS